MLCRVIACVVVVVIVVAVALSGTLSSVYVLYRFMGSIESGLNLQSRAQSKFVNSALHGVKRSGMSKFDINHIRYLFRLLFAIHF